MKRADPFAVLDDEKLRIIKLQAKIVRGSDFFLAGGTGLGIRLQHRLSKDLDWFSPSAFDPRSLATSLRRLSEKPTAVLQNDAHTLRAYYGEFETSFFVYRQVPAQVDKIKIAGEQIPVATLELLAVMKAAAVHDRGTKRDLIDAREICAQPGWSVARFIEHAARNLPLQPEQMALALTYFQDAEKDPMPAGYGRPWRKVKGDLIRGVKSWKAARHSST